MPDAIISQLPEITQSANADILPISTGGITKRIQVKNLKKRIVAAKNINYSPVISGEFILADATDTELTITLPTAIGNSGFVISVKKIDDSAHSVVINTTSSQTIDGELTQTIMMQYQSLDFMSDGANWNLV